MQNRQSELHPVFRKESIDFVTVANEFCLLAERAGDFSKIELLTRAHKLLPLLYFKTAVLPQPAESIGEDYEKFVGEADWHFIEEKISKKLGASQRYMNITLPEHPQDSEEISMSEAFADIYQDLKDFVMLYETGSEDAVNEAMFELTDNFRQIWGPRILAVSAEIHTLLFGIEPVEEEISPAEQTENDDFEDDDFHEIDVRNFFKR